MMLSRIRTIKTLDSVMYIFLLVTCVALPLAMDLSLVNPYVIPKQYLLAAIAVLGVVFWIVRSALSKKISFYQLKINSLFVALGLAAFISALFSDSRLTSFIGRQDYFTMSLVFLAAGWLFFTFVNYTVTSLPRWQGVVDTIIGMGTLTALGVGAKVIFEADVLAPFTGGRFSTIDPMNSVMGVWFAVIFLLAAGQIVKKDTHVSRTILYVVAMVTIFAALMAMNFPAIWWFLIVGLIALVVACCFFIKETRIGWLAGLFAVLVSLGVMMIFSFPKIAATTIPLEIKLNHRASWTITQGSLFSGIKNSLVGNGTGTFYLAFSHFRDRSFNTDPYAWSVRFNQPFSTFQAFLTEGGLMVGILFILIVLYVAGHILKALKLARRDGSGTTVQFFGDGTVASAPLVEVVTLGVTWLMLTVGMFFFFYGPLLWWLWWLLLACFFIGLSISDNTIFSLKEHRLVDNPEYTLSLSFVAIIIVALLVVGGIGATRVYAAEKNYYRALAVPDVNDAKVHLARAIQKNTGNEQYHLMMAQFALQEATNLSREAQPNIQKIGVLVEKAVSESRLATDIAPRYVVVWQNLATMYENAAVLIPEARDWAKRSLEQAYDLEPTNPIIATQLANNLSLAGNYNEAVKKFEEAISLKPDYVAAYVGLAQTHELLKEPAKVVETYRTLVAFQPNNVELIYNYARALYNRNDKGDRDEAERIWLQIVANEPNYSNALYSLGLLYETRGEKTRALIYFRKVLELNPTNKDIKNKVANLSR